MSAVDIPEAAMDAAWRTFSHSYDTHDHDCSTALADAITAVFVGASPNCEQLRLGELIRKGVRRHNGGRAAIRLLAAHGGPDFSGDQDGIS